MKRRALNPDFKAPRDYLSAGLSDAQGALRPELGGALAAALGREFLLVGVPFELAERAAQELEVSQRLATNAADARARLQAIAMRPNYQPQPLLVQLLTAATPVIKRVEDLGLLARHLRRALMLAHFERVLGPANLLEKERAARGAAVRKSRAGEPLSRRRPEPPR